MHRGGYAGQCDSTYITLYPTQHSLGPGEIFSACEYSCGENEEWVSTWLPQLCRAILSHPNQSTDLWTASLKDEKRLEEGHRPLEDIKRMQILLCRRRLHQEACPQVARDALHLDPSKWPMGTPSTLCTSPRCSLIFWPTPHMPCQQWWQEGAFSDS